MVMNTFLSVPSLLAKPNPPAPDPWWIPPISPLAGDSAADKLAAKQAKKDQKWEKELRDEAEETIEAAVKDELNAVSEARKDKRSLLGRIWDTVTVWDTPYERETNRQMEPIMQSQNARVDALLAQMKVKRGPKPFRPGPQEAASTLRAAAKGGSYLPPSYDEDIQGLLNLLYILAPLERMEMTSPYAKVRKLNVYGNVPQVHEGVDFRAAEGTLLRAPCAGTLVPISMNGKGGVQIAIRPDGAHPDSFVYFSHLSSTSKKPGQHVEAGDVIGRTGSTGSCETNPDGSKQPHLHMGVKLGSLALDPAALPWVTWARAGLRPTASGDLSEQMLFNNLAIDLPVLARPAPFAAVEFARLFSRQFAAR